MEDTQLVNGWEEDMSISDSTEFEMEDRCGLTCKQIYSPSQFQLNGSNILEFYANEASKLNELSNDNLISTFDNADECFTYIDDQDMSYYQQSYNHGTNYYNNGYGQDDLLNAFNEKSMLGPIEKPNEPSKINEDGIDVELESEINQLLQEIEENDLVDDLPEDTKETVKEEIKIEPKKEPYYDIKPRYENYDELSEENEDTVPSWYESQIQEKIKETKIRLENLSKMVCFSSASTCQQIRRIEEDHNTPFCKLDYPRHPPLSKPWLNCWKFKCVVKCKVDLESEPNHAHTQNCEMLELEHEPTGTTLRSNNILPCDFPKFVMDTVEVFQDFADLTNKDVSPFIEEDEVPDTVYEKPTWQYILIRSNYKNELMLTVCGKGISPLIKHLKKYFNSGPGRTCNVASLYCINIKWSQKKSKFPPTFISGTLILRDKVGPISIDYRPKTNINFNSIEVQQLRKIMMDYLAPTTETTVVDIGCGIGALSLMLAQKCDKVIGCSMFEPDLATAEEMKLRNKTYNASFICCTAKEIFTKCEPLIKKCISVAAVDLCSQYGKGNDIWIALRHLPSIWRVAVYGPFTSEFRKQITKLTDKDETMGGEFLPMQGCILDKSPSNKKAFTIVILFERKSLIEPSIELIAPGPTINLNIETENSQGSKSNIFKNENNFTENGSTKKFDTAVKDPNYIPKHLRKKFGIFDSPLLPVEKEMKPTVAPIIKEEDKIPQPRPVIGNPFLIKPNLYDKPVTPFRSKELKKIYDSPALPIEPVPKPVEPPAPVEPVKIESVNLPINTDNPFYVPKSESIPLQLIDNPFYVPSKNELTTLPTKSNDSPYGPPIRLKDLKKQYDSGPPSLPSRKEIKLLKKQFDSPSLPMPKEKPSINETLQIKGKELYDPLSCTNENDLDSESSCSRESHTNNSTTSKNENDLNVFPVTIKQERLSPPPQEYIPSLSDQNKVCSVKEEPKINSSMIDDEREEGELSPYSPISETNNISPVVIKREPMDLVDKQIVSSNIVANALIKCETISSDEDSIPFAKVPIKTEPVNVSDLTIAHCSANIKKEPIYNASSYTGESPTEDIENMPTPKHNPSAFNSSPLSNFTNFTNFTLNGFQIEPNQSYLSYKSNADNQSTQQFSSIKVKKELSIDPISKQKSCENNDDEISIISVNEKQRRRNSNEIALQEIKKEKNGEVNNDLRELIEKRSTLKRQLEQGCREPKYNYDRSLSPSEKRQKWSPPLRYRSPSERREKWSPGRYRSISPESKWNRRSRATLSPTENEYIRGSPSFFRRIYDRTPSPVNRRYKRSPSPAERRYQYSPGSSPYIRRYARSPSFSSRNYGRSPSPASRKHVRSPSPLSRRYDRSPSPVSKKYGRSLSPSAKKHRRSRSPISRKHGRSSSVSRKHKQSSPSTSEGKKPKHKKRSKSPSEKKKSKSRKHTSKSKSRSPSSKRKKEKKASKLVGNETKSKEDKVDSNTDNTEWDIPALSEISPIVKKKKSPVSFKISPVKKQNLL